MTYRWWGFLAGALVFLGLAAISGQRDSRMENLAAQLRRFEDGLVGVETRDHALTRLLEDAIDNEQDRFLPIILSHLPPTEVGDTEQLRKLFIWIGKELSATPLDGELVGSLLDLAEILGGGGRARSFTNEWQVRTAPLHRVVDIQAEGLGPGVGLGVPTMALAPDLIAAINVVEASAKSTGVLAANDPKVQTFYGPLRIWAWSAAREGFEGAQDAKGLLQAAVDILQRIGPGRNADPELQRALARQGMVQSLPAVTALVVALVFLFPLGLGGYFWWRTRRGLLPVDPGAETMAEVVPIDMDTGAMTVTDNPITGPGVDTDEAPTLGAPITDEAPIPVKRKHSRRNPQSKRTSRRSRN